MPYPEAMIQVAKDKALKGDQRAAQTLINLMRELDILKPQEAFDPFKSLLAHQGLGSILLTSLERARAGRSFRP